MRIRPGGTAGLSLAFAVGYFGEDDDSFVVTQLGGDSPFGSVLASLGSDYAVHLSPDGAGRSTFNGLDITTPLGNGKGWYIRDCESGEVWSPFFLPVCEKADEHHVTFLPGQVRAFTLKHKIAATITVATLPNRPVEVWLIRLENRSAAERSLAFTTYVEPSIGPGLETIYRNREKLILMRRPLSSIGTEADHGPADMVLFHSSTLNPVRFQTEKSEFVGEGRTLRNPRELDGSGEPASDGLASKAIASLTVEIDLPIEGEAEFGFSFGVARNPEHALELANGLSKVRLMSEAVAFSRIRWEDLCSTVRIDTPDRVLNALVNTWLPYEAYAGWLRQRTGGVCLDPLLAADSLRRYYPLCAGAREACRQSLLTFAAGISSVGTYSPDSESVVMLPPEELAWLPICVARYVAETGDPGVLGESVNCGDGPALTVEEHCERILKLCADPGQAEKPIAEKALRTWPDATGRPPVQYASLSGGDTHQQANLDEDSEHRSLPRRIRHLQLISPTLTESYPKAEMDRLFVAENSPEGDSGAACLAYCVIVEKVLGVETLSNGLRLRPMLPESWPECRITRKFRGDVYNIHVKRSPSLARGSFSVTVDGRRLDGEIVPHFGDGLEHSVEVLTG
ncbi:MAG: hypothetical protein ACP5R5_05500 [Armatimonadota bacterium]